MGNIQRIRKNEWEKEKGKRENTIIMMDNDVITAIEDKRIGKGINGVEKKMCRRT